MAQPILYKVTDILLVFVFDVIPFYTYQYGANYLCLIMLHVATNIAILIYVFIYKYVKKIVKKEWLLINEKENFILFRFVKQKGDWIR